MASALLWMHDSGILRCHSKWQCMTACSSVNTFIIIDVVVMFSVETSPTWTRQNASRTKTKLYCQLVLALGLVQHWSCLINMHVRDDCASQEWQHRGSCTMTGLRSVQNTVTLKVEYHPYNLERQTYKTQNVENTANESFNDLILCFGCWKALASQIDYPPSILEWVSLKKKKNSSVS